MSETYAADMAVVDRFRFSGKPKEVSFDTQTTGRIPWVPHEFHRNKTVFNGRKPRSRDAAEIKPFAKDVGKPLGLLPVNSSSHCSGSSSFQKFTVRYDNSLKRLKVGKRLLECSPSLSRSLKGTGMVEGLLENEQWQKHFTPGRTKRNIHRCFQARVRAHLNPAKIELMEERVKTHIHMLELKAAFLAFQAFHSLA